MRTYIKKFESYLSGHSCFIIDEYEFQELCERRVVNSDSSGKTNFREKEKEYSLSLKALHEEFESSCNGIFGKDSLFKSNVFQDLTYGKLRESEIEYRNISSLGGNVSCQIFEIKDYWFLGYFTYYDFNGHGHIYFKCDQVDGIRDLPKMKSEIFESMDRIRKNPE